jgi:hypothetical protein
VRQRTQIRTEELVPVQRADYTAKAALLALSTMNTMQLAVEDREQVKVSR